MKLLTTKCAYYFSALDKVYYPALLSPTYDNIEYAAYYYQTASKLKMGQINKHQILDTTLPKYLQRQLIEDKTLFTKPKQFLFLGRSNVGKSSLINQLFNNPSICRHSKHPGTTKFLHFHQIENHNTMLIDAPGYGYANMNKKRRHLWFGLIEEYMKVSSRLAQVFLLVNFQHGLKDVDKEFLKRIDPYNVNVQMVLTKVDKINPDKYFSRFRAINQEIRRMDLKNINDIVLACSVKTKFGMGHLKCRLLQAIQQSKPRNIDNNQDLLLSYVKQMRVTPTDINQKQHQLSKEYIVRKLIYNSQLTKYLVK